MDREQLVERIRAQLDVSDPEPDGWRYLTLEGIRLGRVSKDADSHRWVLEWRDGWMRQRAEFDADQPAEKAEIWAAHELAELFAIEERAYEVQREQGAEGQRGG